MRPWWRSRRRAAPALGARGGGAARSRPLFRRPSLPNQPPSSPGHVPDLQRSVQWSVLFPLPSRFWPVSSSRRCLPPSHPYFVLLQVLIRPLPHPTPHHQLPSPPLRPLLLHIRRLFGASLLRRLQTRPRPITCSLSLFRQSLSNPHR